MSKLVTLQLTPEEVRVLDDSLRGSLGYIQDLDDSSQHPGDLMEWGKQLVTVSSILLKIKEASNVKKKNK